MQGIITQSIRTECYRWIAHHVSDGTVEWDSDANLRMGRVLEVLHADGITAEMEPAISSTKKKWIEGVGPFFRDTYAGAEGAESRGHVETMMQEARDELSATLERMLGKRTSQVECAESVVSDDALRSSLIELEKQAVEKAFEAHVRVPLLEAFDDQVNRAKAGR